MNWNGAKVEFVPGACGARREKFIATPLPAFLRGYACPWLGPNLRLASEVQMLWSPQKLKKPITCFIPFTYSAALELTTEEATAKTIEAMKEAGKPCILCSHIREKSLTIFNAFVYHQIMFHYTPTPVEMYQ